VALLSERIVDDLRQPTAASALPGVLADLADQPRLREHFPGVFIAGERALIADQLDRARDRGELAADADPDLVHAQLLGTIFATLFLLDLPATHDLAQRVAAVTTTALETTPL